MNVVQSLAFGKMKVNIYIYRPLKKRCRILHAGGLGVPLRFIKSPRLGDIGN
jgi:hypothetical protein